MNPILIDIFGLQIRWYSVLILVGVILGMYLLIREGKRFKIPSDFLFDVAFWAIIFGICGARIYYCIFNFSDYSANPIDILKVWNGGLAIHGGIIAGAITVYLYSKRYNINFLKVTDMICVPLLLGQAIGRWGNFFNGEAHGPVTSLIALKSWHMPNFIIKGMNIGGLYYQPTFLYESLWCIAGFLILLFIRRRPFIKKGQVTCLYMIWYSIGRFIIESLRTDSLMIGGFKAAQIVSILLFLTGIIVFVYLSRKGKFEDLYNSEERIIKEKK